MNIKSCVKLTRLQCEYLRTLLDQVLKELTSLEQALATEAHPSAALVETYLNGVAKQSAHIAVEADRLQGFVRSRFPLTLL